jgi:hypothetical protein
MRKPGRWIARRVIPQTELWVAESDDGALVGMLVLDDDWVDQFYVEPALTSRGIDGELIALAKRKRPSGLRQWTSESNVGARRSTRGMASTRQIALRVAMRKERPTSCMSGIADDADERDGRDGAG